MNTSRNHVKCSYESPLTISRYLMCLYFWFISGICSAYKGTECMQGAAAWKGRRNCWTESRKK